MQLGVWLSVCQRRAASLESLATSDAARRARQFLSAFLSNRKLVAATLGLLALFIVFWPGRKGSAEVGSAADFCLGEELRGWAREEATFDAHVTHVPPRDWETPLVAFAGNGRFGLAVADDQDELRVRGGRALSLKTGLRPLLKVTVTGDGVQSRADAIVTDYRKGIVTKISSYRRDDECISVRTNIYAHRRFSKLLVQEVTVQNPSSRSLDLTVERSKTGFTEGETIKVGGSSSYVLQSAEVSLSASSSVAVTAAVPVLPDGGRLSVPAKGSEEFRFFLALDSSEPGSADHFQNEKKLLEDGVKETLETVSSMSAGDLTRSHTAVWAKLWEPSFGLSFSRAPDVLNPGLINATRFAVLSNVPAFLHESTSAAAQVAAWEAQLKQPDMQCFNAHNTLLFPGKLWSKLHTAQELVDVAYIWSLTLEKRGGCHQLLEAGADGFALAMLLSFGAFKFTKHHLEFDAHPSELHREREFGSIWYGNGSLISVAVELTEDNKAVLFVSARSDRQFFACDAACLDPPVALKATRTEFPVKLTEPFTPILYVTPERAHLEELKHSIHVKEIAEAAPHEHHVIALHKHGHRLGGLPWGFWLCLGLLIAAFHIFLLKLIFNEYCEKEAAKLGKKVPL